MKASTAEAPTAELPTEPSFAGYGPDGKPRALGASRADDKEVKMWKSAKFLVAAQTEGGIVTRKLYLMALAVLVLLGAIVVSIIAAVLLTKDSAGYTEGTP